MSDSEKKLRHCGWSSCLSLQPVDSGLWKCLCAAQSLCWTQTNLGPAPKPQRRPLRGRRTNLQSSRPGKEGYQIEKWKGGGVWLNPLKHPYIAPNRSLPTVVNLQECGLLFLESAQANLNGFERLMSPDVAWSLRLHISALGQLPSTSRTH